jgi:hypothetical protein
MPLSQEDLVAKLYEARDNLVQQKLEATLKPRPSYNIDGQEVKWTEYLKYLDSALNSILATIQSYEDPYEEETVVNTV